jgi:hypothetical protein
LASPIFILARARPMVRMTSAIGPFSWPKTCSTRERTFDFSALAWRIVSDIGLPFGFLRSEAMAAWREIAELGIAA